MTPEDVVARAKDLEGQEVLLTIRGTVVDGVAGVYLQRLGLLHDVSMADKNGRAERDLVDIRPAPLRIVAGELYRDADGYAYVGRSGGRVFRIEPAGWFGANESYPIPDGLVRAKVVPV